MLVRERLIVVLKWLMVVLKWLVVVLKRFVVVLKRWMASDGAHRGRAWLCTFQCPS